MSNATAVRKGGFPKTLSFKDFPGITAKVYKQTRKKGEASYVSFILAYSLLGKRRLEAFSDYDDAEAAGKDAIRRISEGEQGVLTLSNRDRDAYVRCQELSASVNLDLETLCRVGVEVYTILNGKGSPQEAARLFMKINAKELPRITVQKAVEECLIQCRADGKSEGRMHQLEHYLNGFAGSMNVEVSEVTPSIISRYLTTMVASERTKKNARDVLGYFGRWLVLHGYLARGTDLLENVQKYSMRSGEIHIFNTEEMSRLLKNASARLLPYVAIAGFAGLRGAEIQRLDWSEVGDEFIEVTAEKAKTKVRRLIPIKPNLAAWLKPHRKKAGPVCSFGNVVNQLMKLVAKVNKSLPKNTPEKDRMKWKKNALRHSYISYRVAECADVARVADESGNSPAIIKSNYLKRVKPDQAAEWFNVTP
jgi:integrase